MSHWCDDWFRQKKKREKKRPKLAEIVPPPMRNFLQLVGCAANHLAFFPNPGRNNYDEWVWISNCWCSTRSADNQRSLVYDIGSILPDIDYDQSTVAEPTKWTFPPSLPPPLPLPGWKALPYGLERLWMSAFMWLFTEFYNWGQLWCLKPVSKPPKIIESRGKPNWITLIHGAKVRFNCQKAGHGWTSVLGRVVFWYQFHQETSSLSSVTTSSANGQVLFKLYGQKCQRCSSHEFETALWYPEEIGNAVWHLYADVTEKFYGRSITGVIERVRLGRPTRPHKPQLCQACADGICKRKKNVS